MAPIIPSAISVEPEQNAFSVAETTIPIEASPGEKGDADVNVASSGEAATMSKLEKHVSIQDQSSRMPMRKILVVYIGIGIALVLSFMDQTSVSTAAPVIGTALNGSDTISWVGTSFFVSNCAFHLVYGRLSDIFGRKTMLQVALFFLGLGNLLCGFAKTPVQLYIFRAISGMGGGGVNGIAMVIVSDIVPLKDRGKYQGLISAFCSIGSAIGPFLGGGLSSAGQWRWVFWTTTICAAIIIVIDHLVLPLKPVTGSMSRKLRQIDYLGIFLSAAGAVLLLVPISGGGSIFAWDSAAVIGMLIVGALSFVAFGVAEWKFTKLPILPLRLFKDRTTSAVMIQSFLIGMIYYGNIFYIPTYFQYVKGYSSLLSGAYVLVYSLPGALWGISSGWYVSKTNRYKIVILLGGAIWATSQGLQIIWTAHSSLALVLCTLEINTVGVGFILQTTLVAALNTTPAPDRAVVTSARNFFRTMGGAFGLAMANAIYNNTVSAKLLLITSLTPSNRAALLTSAIDALKTLSPELKSQVVDAYAEGLRIVFIAFTSIAVAFFLLGFAVKEVVFQKDSPELEAEKRRNRNKELKIRNGDGNEAGVSEQENEVREQEEDHDPGLEDEKKVNEESSVSTSSTLLDSNDPGGSREYDPVVPSLDNYQDVRDVSRVYES